MFKAGVWFFVNVLVLVNCNVLHKAQLLKVSIYYESLCPDSVNFITRQLAPNYNEIRDDVNIEFVPFGKAVATNVNGEWEFECQHGPRECYGNKMQGCGLIQSNDQDVEVQFVNCVMSAPLPSADDALQSCAEENGLSWAQMTVCRDDGTGAAKLAEFGERTNTLEPPLSFVPTIVYNDVYNSTLQEESLTNFLETVRKLING